MDLDLLFPSCHRSQNQVSRRGVEATRSEAVQRQIESIGGCQHMGRPIKKQRGVYERDKGSGVWWICYADQSGRTQKEKVGKRKDAIKRYHQRKTQVLEDKFDPEDVKTRRATVTEIIDDRLRAAQTLRSFDDERQRLLWWKERFGDRVARSIVAS